MSENNVPESISQDQTYNVVQFAQSLLGGQGYYTPQLTNQLLLNLNVNPRKADLDKITKALNNAKFQARELQGYSQWMEYNDMLYSRMIKYYCGLLSWDLSSYALGATAKDFKSKEYKDDKKRRDKFFAKFEYKKEFEKVMMEVMRTGVCYGWLRTNKGSYDKVNDGSLETSYKRATKYTVQIMPQEYCMTTGYFEQGMLYDIDMTYFLQPGVDLAQFDPFLSQSYKETMLDGDNTSYNPSARLTRRDTTWAYWAQTSPDSGAFMVKFDNSNFLNMPPLAPLLRSSVLNPALQDLQYDKDILSAYALLSGELKMLDGQKSGEVKNAFAISPDVLGQLMALVQSGLNNNVKSVALPLENTQWSQFTDSNKDMSTTQYLSNTAQGVGASTTMYNTEKMSQSEVENAIWGDYMFVSHIYSQFEDVLNFYVNKKTKKYEWRHKLSGLNRPFGRQLKREALVEMVNVGLTPSVSHMASAYGMTEQELESSLIEAKECGLFDDLLLLQTINTQSGKSNDKGGRPRIRTSDSHDYDGGGA